LTLHNPIYDPLHGFKPQKLFIKFLLLALGQFPPAAGRLNTGLEAMQQTADFFQSEAASLGEPQNGFFPNIGSRKLACCSLPRVCLLSWRSLT
jgi:hypothetical protein